MKLGAKLDMVILGRIYAPSKGPKWAQRGEKLTTNNHTTRKINKNEKNSKLRVFFGWCHCHRIDIDVRLLMQMFQKP